MKEGEKNLKRQKEAKNEWLKKYSKKCYFKNEGLNKSGKKKKKTKKEILYIWNNL